MELKAGTYLSFSSLAKLHSPSIWGTCCHPAACPPTAHTDIEGCSHQVDSWIHGAQSQSSHLIQFLDPVLSEVFNLSQLLEHLLDVNRWDHQRSGWQHVQSAENWFLFASLVLLGVSDILPLSLPSCLLLGACLETSQLFGWALLPPQGVLNKILKCCTRMKLSLLVSYLYWGLK